ncbi:MAG: hypothetical protein P8X55_07525 [Desulfosarcinaceae bacterium]
MPFTRPIKIALLGICLAAALAASCAGPPDPTSRSNGSLFRQRWWNYYQRARTAADAGDYAAARQDLDAALDQRGRDQRMARTYGMHFIDYFPHRELGVLYWLEGDLNAAEAQLALSIEQAPSAKAYFYLDQVRRRLIRRKGATVAPPRLDLPGGPLRTTSTEVTLHGRAHDPHYVSGIRIDGQPQFMQGARTDVEFSRTLSLPQGCHKIPVEAENLGGGRTARTVEICVDSLGPAVVFDRIEPRPEGVFIAGAALDTAGVKTFSFNGRRLPVGGEADEAFAFVLKNPSEDIRIECHDRLGNRSEYHFKGGDLRSGRTRTRHLAGLRLAGLFDARDDQPPVIRLQDWQDSQAVYLEKVVLSGSVGDPGTVASLTVNGEPALPREGPMVFFTHIVDLAPGPNAITLEARDAAGNLKTRRLSIERRIPKALLLEERLRLTIFAFEQKGRVSAASFAFQDDFIHAMVGRRRFQVVERQRLDLILHDRHRNRRNSLHGRCLWRRQDVAGTEDPGPGPEPEAAPRVPPGGRRSDRQAGGYHRHRSYPREAARPAATACLRLPYRDRPRNGKGNGNGLRCPGRRPHHPGRGPSGQGAASGQERRHHPTAPPRHHSVVACPVKFLNRKASGKLYVNFVRA